MCEAEERLLQIAYEIELQWGAGRIDLGRLKSLTAGDKCAGHGPGMADIRRSAAFGVTANHDETSPVVGRLRRFGDQ